ncbi:MAG: crossover junction endodeoxyribonuclease RuvC [Oscillospiraceae bacterium]|jgi:crossover junction endodeoxyribonuclease RuvC|nr:crossover junction endodeoxyribonuclease RuvC [Oscillospiraceae bacterium]
MRILGIDPGYAIVGVGMIEYINTKHILLEASAVTTPAGMPFADRLNCIYNGIHRQIETHRPDALACEKLFFNTNAKTAIDVAQARGVILLAARQKDVPVYEYTPLQVKQSIVGYGRAEKRQVQEMVKLFLNLTAIPKPDDIADALAIAVCHAHTAGSSLMAL